MFLLPLELPPGVLRGGTEYKSAGRWYDANLMRWNSGVMGPIGGWRAHSKSAVTGKPRSILAWRDNSNTSWAAIGTESHLYAMGRDGTLYDITPVGFTSGRADATAAGGYGSGSYGQGLYGQPTLDVTQIQDATVWSLDTYGQYLHGISPDDGVLYTWTLNTSSPAVKVTNSPSGSAVVVTSERMVMVLGAQGDPRQIWWSDQTSENTWTPLTSNTAGTYNITTSGRLMCGKRLSGVTGIWTDVDFWIAQYVGSPYIYGFTKIESGCGALSRNCVAVANSQAAWMGRGAFYLFNQQAVQAIPCEVNDYVFTNINYQQCSKVSAFHNSQFGEVWWLYPSASSTENDSYVVWNYRENHWNIGKIARLSGADAGAFQFPLMCGSDGNVYDHEVGGAWDGVQPYATSGPVEVPTGFFQAPGGGVYYGQYFIADEKTVGQWSVTLNARLDPNASVVTAGPFTASTSDRIPVRFCARQVEFTTQTSSETARWGNARLQVIPGGMR